MKKFWSNMLEFHLNPFARWFGKFFDTTPKASFREFPAEKKQQHILILNFGIKNCFRKVFEDDWWYCFTWCAIAIQAMKKKRNKKRFSKLMASSSILSQVVTLAHTHTHAVYTHTCESLLEMKKKKCVSTVCVRVFVYMPYILHYSCKYKNFFKGSS